MDNFIVEMNMDHPTKEQIKQAFDICVECCGARESDFVNGGESYFLTDDNPEWRFQGALGFGGKLYWQRHRGFSVSYYLEDKTQFRDQMVSEANKKFKSMNTGGI